MSDLQILIQEVARIALEDAATTARIAHELGETEEELQLLAGYLNSLLEDTYDEFGVNTKNSFNTDPVIAELLKRKSK